MMNFLLALCILLPVGAVILFLIREKRRGRHCIGCPYAASCGKNKSCTCVPKKPDNAE